MGFEQVDLRDGLGPVATEEPFDIYFSAYGALSHLDGAALRACLRQIVDHAAPGALVVLDLIGRHSPEWPAYWNQADQAEELCDYSMSYLYEDGERESGSVERFKLRLWNDAELLALCREISEGAARPLQVLQLVDRSMFVGRHVDTGEYGALVPPLRGAVNCLYELNVRTNLERLRVRYRSVAGAPELNRFFASLAMSWNQLVDFTMARLRGERLDLVPMDGWYEFPPALQMALMSMDRVMDGVAWVKLGDVRANIIEPQLAYLLRSLEFGMQPGRGCGHGFLALLRVGEGN